MSGYDVVIVGGGPVGMGLAIELGQRGVGVAVVERRTKPQQVPKGQNLTQRSLESIDAWGCEPALRAARVVPRGVANGGLVTYGTLLSDYAYDWFPREKVGPYYGQALDRLPQYETERVLRARAADLDTVATYYGWSFAGIAEAEDGVRVEIEEREGEGRRTLQGTYAVGCDGSRSALRCAAGLTQTVSDHDRRMALIVFRSPDLHRLLGERYPERSFYNALSPELDGYWLFLGRVDLGSEWFFHAPVPEGTTEADFDAAAFLHRAVGRPFDLDVTHAGFWDLRVALADSYRAGRVFIAGDAAHSHPPYGGYGINTGFEDARNLGWKLAADLQGWGGPKLLDSYDAERRPVFASTARDFIERFIEQDRAFLATHRPDADPEAFARAWAARPDASEIVSFEPNYEGSPIVAGTGSPSAKGDHRFEARAGHHLAPRALSDGRTTYEALGRGFTLFRFDGVGAARTECGVPLETVTDSYEGERRDYGARAILVRPDGFVAWAGADCPDIAPVLRMAAGG
jgi:2-polyprenyl-6-methoxyphenol hydroxylase-like FAD-dependent oxidoreductase